MGVVVMNTIFEYEAKIVSAKVQGESIPTFQEIIEDIFSNNRGVEIKTEELVEETAIRIGFPKDSSLQGKVAGVLKKLEKAKVIVRGSNHGYWVMK